MWLRRKKNHLIGMMRKNKRHFAPPAVFQPLTLVHFVGLICWSCCKIREAGTLLHFVFAECSVQVHPLLSWFLLVVIMVMIKSYRQQHWKEREKLSLEEPLACLACGLLFPMSSQPCPLRHPRTLHTVLDYLMVELNPFMSHCSFLPFPTAHFQVSQSFHKNIKLFLSKCDNLQMPLLDFISLIPDHLSSLPRSL